MIEKEKESQGVLLYERHARSLRDNVSVSSPRYPYSFVVITERDIVSELPYK